MSSRCWYGAHSRQLGPRALGRRHRGRHVRSLDATCQPCRTGACANDIGRASVAACTSSPIMTWLACVHPGWGYSAWSSGTRMACCATSADGGWAHSGSTSGARTRSPLATIGYATASLWAIRYRRWPSAEACPQRLIGRPQSRNVRHGST